MNKKDVMAFVRQSFDKSIDTGVEAHAGADRQNL